MPVSLDLSTIAVTASTSAQPSTSAGLHSAAGHEMEGNTPTSTGSNLAPEDEAMDTLDSSSLPTKLERVSPTPSPNGFVDPPPNGFVSQPPNPSQTTSGITLQQFSSLLSAEFAKNNAGIYSRIDQLASQISVIDTKVKPIATLNQALNDLDNRVAALENNNVNPAPPQQPIDINNLAYELQDRLARSRNIILYGIVEVQGTSQVNDTEQAASILSRIPGIDLSNVVVRRLGKFVAGGKPRPLLIRLISADEVRRVLRNRHCLPQGISASSDKTSSEREYLKAIIDEVTRHNETNPNNKKKIRYINGVPTIVDDTSRQRGSKN